MTGKENEILRRLSGSRIKSQMVDVMRPADVARTLGITKQAVNNITNRALGKIAIRMRELMYER